MPHEVTLELHQLHIGIVYLAHDFWAVLVVKQRKLLREVDLLHINSWFATGPLCRYCTSNPLSPLPFSVASSGGMTDVAATRSPSSICRRRTPCDERPHSRMVLAPMRMILPNWLMTISSDSSFTSMMETTLPLRAVVFTLMTPWPRRDCSRYSSTSVRLPYPFSVTERMRFASCSSPFSAFLPAFGVTAMPTM